MRMFAPLLLVVLCGCPTKVETATSCKPTAYQAVANPDLATLEIETDELDGRYVNMAVINHTDAEFTIDFIHVDPDGKRGRIRARVVSSPAHTKRLLAALEENVGKYDGKFGKK